MNLYENGVKQEIWGDLRSCCSSPLPTLLILLIPLNYLRGTAGFWGHMCASAHTTHIMLR